MKAPILVAVRLKGQRGRKESFQQQGGTTHASFETWPPASEWPPKDDGKAFREWAGFDGTGWDNGE